LLEYRSSKATLSSLTFSIVMFLSISSILISSSSLVSYVADRVRFRSIRLAVRLTLARLAGFLLEETIVVTFRKNLRQGAQSVTIPVSTCVEPRFCC
jgi:hypothetical protein